MVALAHDNMQVPLSCAPRILYSLFQDVFGLFHELSMQIDRVSRHTVSRVILSKDKFRSLFVVLFHSLAMGLSFVAKGFCGAAIAVVVGFLAALKAVTSFRRLLSR